MHCAYLVWHPQKRKVMNRESFFETGGEANCSNLLLSSFLNCLVERIRILISWIKQSCKHRTLLLYIFMFVEWRVCTDYYYNYLLLFPACPHPASRGRGSCGAWCCRSRCCSGRGRGRGRRGPWGRGRGYAAPRGRRRGYSDLPTPSRHSRKKYSRKKV